MGCRWVELGGDLDGFAQVISDWQLVPGDVRTAIVLPTETEKVYYLFTVSLQKSG
jgi:hypothetical protein